MFAPRAGRGICCGPANGPKIKQLQLAAETGDERLGLLGDMGGAAIDDQKNLVLGSNHEALEEFDGTHGLKQHEYGAKPKATGNHDLVARCEKDAQDALGAAASAARSQPYYLDVTHPDANKGTVVTTLSKLLSVPTSEIATIGDMPNDVLMFRKSGLSIAMGNASRHVQAQAEALPRRLNGSSCTARPTLSEAR
jgi:hydroxymethylpyrimidine pyrophosphatase-like HAD family hydrolase